MQERDGISLSFLRPLAQGLERRGLLSTPLHRALAGTESEAIDVRLPGQAIDEALEALVRSTSPSLLLDLAANAPPGSFGFLDYCAAASHTLREAIERTARFYGLLSSRAQLMLEEHANDKLARVRQTFVGDAPKRRYLTELAAAIVAVRAKQLSGDAFHLDAVSFMHDRIAEEKAYVSVFGVVPQFDAARDELVLDRKYLDLPIHTANPLVAALIEKHAIERLSRRDEAPDVDPFRAKLKDAIIAALEKGVEISSCASALRVAPRTLQRRLREQGTSFSKVVDDARHELAVDLFRRDRETSISEVAFRLGFRDLSAFHRAFRRWTGQTPQEFRRSRGKRTGDHP